jgi:hypothetical protein
LKNSKLLLTISGIIILIFFWITVDSELDCDSFIEKEKLEKYSGIITEKYIDQNDHNHQKVILDKNSGTDVIILNWETSGLYEYLKVGDSITKNSGTLELKIRRNYSDTIYNLSFFCLTKISSSHKNK